MVSPVSTSVSVALVPASELQPICVKPGQTDPEKACMSALKEALGLTLIVAVDAMAKNLYHTSLAGALEPPVTEQVGEGAQGSSAVVGSNATWLENEVPPPLQPLIHDWLNVTALENRVPPPNICAEPEKNELINNRKVMALRNIVESIYSVVNIIYF